MAFRRFRRKKFGRSYGGKMRFARRLRARLRRGGYRF